MLNTQNNHVCIFLIFESSGYESDKDVVHSNHESSAIVAWHAWSDGKITERAAERLIAGVCS